MDRMEHRRGFAAVLKTSVFSKSWASQCFTILPCCWGSWSRSLCAKRQIASWPSGPVWLQLVCRKEIAVLSAQCTVSLLSYQWIVCLSLAAQKEFLPEQKSPRDPIQASGPTRVDPRTNLKRFRLTKAKEMQLWCNCQLSTICVWTQRWRLINNEIPINLI